MARRISNYVSYKEVTYSTTAIKKGLDNNPNEEQLQRIIKLANKVFDPLRVWCGGRVKINSVFRGEELNGLIGGSRTSQHMANKGAAIDIDDNYRHKTNLEMFHYIKDHLEFDQLIGEFPVDGQPRWVHVSYNEGANRGRVMIATKQGGRTQYVLYDGNEQLLG
jgi:zinc D-Ala-D-Ala carboxypeptidase